MNAPRVANEITAGQVSREKLMEDLRMVVADADELLRATANQTGEQIVAARAKASESLQAARLRLAEAQASAIERARLAARTTDDYVHANPWQSVGIAATLGVLLGALIFRR